MLFLESYSSFWARFTHHTDIYISFLISWWSQWDFGYFGFFFVVIWDCCFFWLIAVGLISSESPSAFDASQRAFSYGLVLLLWIFCNQLNWHFCSFRTHLWAACVDLTKSVLSLLEPLFALLKDLLVTLACRADGATLKGVLDQQQPEKFC